MIFDSKKINFIHIPKAAGSSVGKCLREQIPKTKADNKLQSDFGIFSKDKGFAFPNHAPAEIRQQFLGDEAYSNYFSFAFVRNPFDLLVSLYEYTKQTEVKIFKEKGWELNQFQKNILDNSFNDWVTHYNTGKPQKNWIFSEKNELLVSFVGKTESFDRDFGYLAKALELSDTSSTKQKQNTTEREGYREYFNPATRRVVEKKYKKDLDLFGYSY